MTDKNELIITAENIIYGYFIKYSRLLELVTTTFEGSDASEINIYIDLGDIYRNLLTRYDIQMSSQMVVSGVLNLCGHLKNYFLTRHRVTSKIFIVNGYNVEETQNRLCFGGYDNKYKAIVYSNSNVRIIRESEKLLDMIVPYLDQIYSIGGSNFESAVVIYDIMKKEIENGNLNPNIILSKSLYAYQLPAIVPETYLFRPKKFKGKDMSYVIKFTNALTMFVVDSRHGTVSQNTLDNLTRFNPKLISMIMAISGLSCRNLKPILNIDSTLKALEEAIDKNQIMNDYNYAFESSIHTLNQPKILTNVIEIVGRVKAIDILYQHGMYAYTPSAKVPYIVDLVDDNAVRYLNDQYFKEFPIELNKL